MVVKSRSLRTRLSKLHGEIKLFVLKSYKVKTVFL